jgi:hypothetical protein
MSEQKSKDNTKKNYKKSFPKFSHMIRFYKFTNIAVATTETYPYRAIFVKNGGDFYKKISYKDENGNTKMLTNVFTIDLDKFESIVSKLKSLTSNVLVFEVKHTSLNVNNIMDSTIHEDDTRSLKTCDFYNDDNFSITSNIAKYERFDMDDVPTNIQNINSEKLII